LVCFFVPMEVKFDKGWSPLIKSLGQPRRGPRPGWPCACTGATKRGHPKARAPRECSWGPKNGPGPPPWALTSPMPVGGRSNGPWARFAVLKPPGNRPKWVSPKAASRFQPGWRGKTPNFPPCNGALGGPLGSQNGPKNAPRKNFCLGNGQKEFRADPWGQESGAVRHGWLSAPNGNPNPDAGPGRFREGHPPNVGDPKSPPCPPPSLQ